ncbi:hypothetical protein, partial [Aeromonas veronii]|uniref:hypothetical protein n=1 Tax=Aeromonas veronii TaxID=654 RepID=UPI001961F351
PGTQFKNPAHRAGFFIGCNSVSRLIIDPSYLFSSVLIVTRRCFLVPQIARCSAWYSFFAEPLSLFSVALASSYPVHPMIAYTS